MLQDVEHLQSKLSKIDGSKELTDRLLEIVQSKTIATPTEEPEKDKEKEKAETETEDDKGDQQKASDAA